MSEDITIFKNTKLEMWMYNRDTLAILISDYKIAKKLNKTIQYYDSNIVEGDEPLFLITHPKVVQIAAAIVPAKGITSMVKLLTKYFPN